MSAVLDTVDEPNPTPFADSTPTERAVVGALLLAGGTAQREILAAVDDQDFGDPMCQWIITHARVMISKGWPCNAVTLPAWATRHGITPMDRAASRANLRVQITDMIADTPTGPFGPWYAAQVVEAAARRRIHNTGVRVQNMAAAGELRETRAALIAEFTAAMTAVDRAIHCMD